ncbi:MAG: hypothetical protein FWC21_00505 [Treponema sp.]|nr:hypothetical protein [Treponema sp.]
MRIILKCRFGQLSFKIMAVLILILSSCSSNKEETPVIPPVTSPLSGEYIGFGVITSSFTHILADPSDNSGSLGYLRRGSLVKILRRQIINTSEGFISWVFIDNGAHDSNNQAGPSAFQAGWLKEDVMDIYAVEGQARTAAEFILR